MDRTKKDPKADDRSYWRSKEVVNQSHEVSKPRWQVLPYDSTRRPVPEKETSSLADRQHWQGQTVVQGASNQGTMDMGAFNPQYVEAMTRKDLNKMGRRENNIQRQIRGRISVQTETGVMELPSEVLDGREFDLVVPATMDLGRQHQVQTNPIPSKWGLDTLKELDGHPIADDDALQQNRKYWGGREVVSKPSRAFHAKNI